jgi:hypothetical protein
VNETSVKCRFKRNEINFAGSQFLRPFFIQIFKE